MKRNWFGWVISSRINIQNTVGQLYSGVPGQEQNPVIAYTSWSSYIATRLKKECPGTWTLDYASFQGKERLRTGVVLPNLNQKPKRQ